MTRDEWSDEEEEYLKKGEEDSRNQHRLKSENPGLVTYLENFSYSRRKTERKVPQGTCRSHQLTFCITVLKR